MNYSTQHGRCEHYEPAHVDTYKPDIQAARFAVPCYEAACDAALHIHEHVDGS
jgi:hypothetical protein